MTIGSATAFLELVCTEVPSVVLSVTRALADNDLTATYARLPNVDFSLDILVPQAKRLFMLRDSGSGWADLGSPSRVLGLLANNVKHPAWFRQNKQRFATARRAIQLRDQALQRAKIPSNLPPELRRLFLLPPLGRDCFVLRMLMGFTMETTSGILDLDRDEVYETLYRALSDLPRLAVVQSALAPTAETRGGDWPRGPSEFLIGVLRAGASLQPQYPGAARASTALLART